MPSTCFSPIFGTSMRLVRANSCGVAVSGASGQLVTEGWIKVDLKPQYEAGKEHIVTNAHGKICVNKKQRDRFKRYDLTFTLCEVDPQAIELLTGARILTASGTAVGNAFGETDEGNALQVEIWQELAGDDECTTGSQQFLHHVLPLVINGVIADMSIEDAPTQVVINASTKANPNYADGPFNLWTDNPIQAHDHHLYQVTTVVPPVGACGYQALVPV